MISTPGLQQGIAQEMAQLLEMLQVDAEGFRQLFMEQVQGGNRFSGPLFSLLRQTYGSLSGDHVRQSILEFAKRYSDFSSTAHIGRNMTSLLQQITERLPRSWQDNMNQLLAQLENGLAFRQPGGQSEAASGGDHPLLGSYVERTHDMGPLREMLNRLVLDVARYENGSEGQLLQFFPADGGVQRAAQGSQPAGRQRHFEAAAGENDFTRAAGSRFAEGLAHAASQALRGLYGHEVQESFAELVRALLIQESVYMPLNHMLFPVEWQGKMMYSEMWVDPDAEEQGGSGQEQDHKVQFSLQAGSGVSGLSGDCPVLRQDQVEMQIYGPDTVQANSGLIAEDMRDILTSHGLASKDVRGVQTGKASDADGGFSQFV